MLGRQLCPDRIESPQPVEETRVLGARHRTGECLIEVVMGVDEARNDHVARQVDDLVRLIRQVLGPTHLLYESVDGIDGPVFDLEALVVHGRQDQSVFGEERGHCGGDPTRRLFLYRATARVRRFIMRDFPTG